MSIITVKRGSIKRDNALPLPLDELLSSGSLDYYTTKMNGEPYWQQHLNKCRRLSQFFDKVPEGSETPLYTRYMTLYQGFAYTANAQKVLGKEDLERIAQEIRSYLPAGAIAHVVTEESRRGGVYFELHLSVTDDHTLSFEL